MKFGLTLSLALSLIVVLFSILQRKKSPNEADKYTCSIYLDRPEDCRHYPSLISEMVRDGCEMIEITDLQQPKKAQVKLDILMQDSRPSHF